MDNDNQNVSKKGLIAIVTANQKFLIALTAIIAIMALSISVGIQTGIAAGLKEFGGFLLGFVFIWYLVS